MSRAVQTQFWRILVVYGLIAGVVTWQWHFVYTGVVSNPYLNTIIILVFLFGSMKLVTSLWQLRNEEVAFKALQEVWTDVQDTRKSTGADQFDRYERCFRPGRVYGRPKLLGHIFELALEELLRTRQMRISIATMQNLIHAIDGRINLEKSLIGYVGGLCIFLGLIGTFIGLMEMVQSVGGIIGNVAADGGGGNPTDKISGLISSLQAPLNGMATGFSSSLFGLFGSLVLGLVAKFTSQATGVVRDEFEAWLASISEIESQTDVDMPDQGRAGFAAGQLGGLAVSLMGGFRRNNQSLDNAADSIRQLSQRQAQQVDLITRAVDQMEKFAAQEGKIRQALARTDAIWSQLAKTREDLHRIESTVANRVADGFQAVTVKMSVDNAAHLASLQQLSARQAELSGKLDLLSSDTQQQFNAVDSSLTTLRTETADIAQQAAQGRQQTAEALASVSALARDAVSVASAARDEAAQTALVSARSREQTSETLATITALAREAVSVAAAAELAARMRGDELSAVAERTAALSTAFGILADTAARQPEAMAAAIRPALADGFGVLSQSLGATSETLRAGLGHLAAQQTELAQALDASGPARALTDELREVARTIEGSMTQGFTDLARSVEGIFLSYADLARRNNEAPAVTVPVVVAGNDEVSSAPNEATLDRIRTLAERVHPVAGGRARP